MARSMKDQLSMWTLWNLPEKISRKRTSSQESGVGAMPSDSPNGQMTGLCGLEAAPASRSPQPEKARAKRTSATSGPSSSTSSAPAAPLSSWESKLRQRLASLGSTECLLTWKESVTPQGRPLSRLVPSMRPIEETDCGLWPTPRANKHAGKDRADFSPSLHNVVYAMWPTPTTTDAKRGVGTIRPHDTGIPLPQRVAQVMSLWHTPTCHMAREEGYPAEFTRKTPTMTAEAYTALGLTASGSPGQTEKPGALAPEFVCWLMGYPTAWDNCAPTAMPSFRRSRQK